MKTKLVSILGALALLLCTTGCVSSPAKMGKDYAEFAQSIPGATITDISTVTQSPLWGFSASASGISTNPDTRTLSITNGKVSFSIPLWGFSKTFNVSGLTLVASQAQVDAAKALQASSPPPPAK